MLGHYTTEEKRKFIIFSVVGILATLALVGVFFSLFSVKKNGAEKKDADQSEASALKSSAEVLAQYIGALDGVKIGISLPVNESSVSKVETLLFAMRVPKEMLDKHLQAVFAVGKLKNEKDVVSANEQVKKIINDLLIEAKKI